MTSPSSKMGAASTVLPAPELREKIKQSIAKLDIESQKLLHNDMRPVEVALLVMLHQKHSDEITLYSAQKGWKWDENSLLSEYKKRLNDLNREDEHKDSAENFIQKAKEEIANLDGIFDNSSSDEESQAVLNNYYAKQAETVSRLNIERARELKAQLENSSDFVDDISIRGKYQQKLKEINDNFQESMLKYFKNQKQKMSEVLDDYHSEQLKILAAMDKELTIEVKRRNCPTSAILLEKVRTKGDPVLDDKKSSAIDGIINMDKSKLSQEELKNLFSEQIAQENILQVGVPLPHRPKQDQPGNNPLKNTVARHYQNQVVSPNSLIRHCDDINPKFEEAKTEPQE